MEEQSDVITSVAMFGRRKGVIHWHHPLPIEFPSESERSEIAALFDDAMRTFDTVVFYVHYTDFGTKEIIWTSSLDEETDEIRIDAGLSTRFNRDEAGGLQLPPELLEYLEWCENMYDNTAPPYPTDVEELQAEFHRWKAKQEGNK